MQDNLSLLDESYSPFHVELEMNSEFDFGDFIPRDDRGLCEMADDNLSLPTIARTCNVIDCFVTITSYEQICESIFIMVQHI
jgi:hypothetical protein